MGIALRLLIARLIHGGRAHMPVGNRLTEEAALMPAIRTSTLATTAAEVAEAGAAATALVLLS